MKSGLIIYVVGEEPPNWDAAFESMAIKKIPTGGQYSVQRSKDPLNVFKLLSR